MSGGSYDYFYSRLENDYIYTLARNAETPQRKAFLRHLFKIAKAMKEIELVDSGDCLPGNENESIMECINHTQVLDCAIEDAKEMIKTLESLIGKESP